ncbi:MAG: hypothetical protein ABIT36_02815 [Steroidobacteraceae bacterium]
MGELSEWLNIMLGEISRKQDDAVRAQREHELRAEFPVARGADTPPDPSLGTQR